MVCCKALAVQASCGLAVAVVVVVADQVERGRLGGGPHPAKWFS